MIYKRYLFLLAIALLAISAFTQSSTTFALDKNQIASGVANLCRRYFMRGPRGPGRRMEADDDNDDDDTETDADNDLDDNPSSSPSTNSSTVEPWKMCFMRWSFVDPSGRGSSDNSTITSTAVYRILSHDMDDSGAFAQGIVGASIIETLDTNKDGNISESEFKEVMEDELKNEKINPRRRRPRRRGRRGGRRSGGWN